MHAQCRGCAFGSAGSGCLKVCAGGAGSQMVKLPLESGRRWRFIVSICSCCLGVWALLGASTRGTSMHGTCTRGTSTRVARAHVWHERAWHEHYASCKVLSTHTHGSAPLPCLAGLSEHSVHDSPLLSTPIPFGCHAITCCPPPAGAPGAACALLPLLALISVPRAALHPYLAPPSSHIS